MWGAQRSNRQARNSHSECQLKAPPLLAGSVNPIPSLPALPPSLHHGLPASLPSLSLPLLQLLQDPPSPPPPLRPLPAPCPPLRGRVSRGLLCSTTPELPPTLCAAATPATLSTITTTSTAVCHTARAWPAGWITPWLAGLPMPITNRSGRAPRLASRPHPCGCGAAPAPAPASLHCVGWEGGWVGRCL